MKIFYRDWTRKEIETAIRLSKEHETYAAVSRHLNRPYGQVRTLLAKAEKIERQESYGITPFSPTVPRLRTLAGKLRKLDSPLASICEEAAEYIIELTQRLNENIKPIKSVWNNVEE